MSDKLKNGGAQETPAAVVEVPAAPAAQAATPAPAAPATPAPEGGKMDKVLDRVMNGMFGKGNPGTQEKSAEAAKPAEQKETKAEAKPAGTDAAKAGEAAAATPTPAGTVEVPKVKPRPKKKEAPAPTATEVAAAAAKAATSAVLEVVGPKKDEKPAEGEKEIALNPQFKGEEEIYRHLAKTDPKYADLIPRLNRFAEDFSDFKKAWMKDHPGEKFDPNSEEAQAWMDQNEPVVSDRDLAKAAGAIEARKETEAIRKERREEVSKQESEQLVDRLIDSSRKAVAGAAQAAILAAAGDAGAAGFSDELATKTLEDPIVEMVVEHSLQEWAPVVEAAGMLMAPGGARVYDRTNPNHVKVSRAIGALEQALSELPDSTDEQGRVFATRQEFAAMSPEDRANHYIVDADAVLGLLGKSIQQEVRARLKKVGKGPGSAAAPGSQSKEGVQKSGQEKPVEKPAEEVARPAARATSNGSPSIGTGGPTIVSGASGDTGGGDIYDRVIRRMVGK